MCLLTTHLDLVIGFTNLFDIRTIHLFERFILILKPIMDTTTLIFGTDSTIKSDIST